MDTAARGRCPVQAHVLVHGELARVVLHPRYGSGAIAAASRRACCAVLNCQPWYAQRPFHCFPWLQSKLARGVAKHFAPLGLELFYATGTTIDAESKQAIEDFSKLFGSAAQRVLAFTDDIDCQARDALKAKGLVRYVKYTEEEVNFRAAEREASKRAAKEAASIMKEGDSPIDFNPDDFD